MNDKKARFTIIALFFAVSSLLLLTVGAVVASSQLAPARQNGMNTVQVELDEYEIRMPRELPAGQTRFVVTNVGNRVHNFVIEGQGLEQSFEGNLRPGETGRMTVTLDPGEYEVYCPINGHRALGMELTLTVNEAEAQASPASTAQASPTPSAISQEEMAPAEAAGAVAVALVDAEGRQLGNVDNLLFNRAGDIQFVIAAMDAAQDNGPEMVAIPWQQVDVSVDGNEVALVFDGNVDDLSRLTASDQRLLSDAAPFVNVNRADLNTDDNRLFEAAAFVGMEQAGPAVVDEDNNQLGQIRDILANQQGAIQFVVLTMDEDGALVLVPWDLIDLSTEGNRANIVFTGMSQQLLRLTGRDRQLLDDVRPFVRTNRANLATAADRLFELASFIGAAQAPIAAQPTAMPTTEVQPTATPTTEATATPEATAMPGATAEAGAFGIFNRHVSTDAAITAANVGDLARGWQVETDTMVSHTPLVANGVVYFADWSGTVYAVDEETGDVIWQNQVEEPMTQWPWHGFAGTGALTDELLIEASVEGNVFALDRETGDVVWQTSYTDQPTAGNLSTLLVHDGLVYVGIQSVDEPLSAMREDFEPAAQGGVVALDVESGDEAWRFMTVEPPANGVTVWSSFALDPELNALYFTTGNNYTGEATSLSDSIVAVDAVSGEMLWSYQVTQQDVWTPATPLGPDYDFGAGPQLFEATIDGETRRLVGAGQKNGFFTVWDRETGEFIWSTSVGIAGVGGGIRGEAAVADGQIIAWSNNSWNDVVMPPRDPENFPIDVKALDPATGRYLWGRFGTQPAIGLAAGFLANDVYFAGSLEGTVQAYSADDGATLWSDTLPSGVSSSLVVDGDTLFVGVGVPPAFGGLSGGPSGVYTYSLTP